MAEPSKVPSTPPPVARREIVAWAMFDFANSSYTTIVVTVAYSVFFTRLVAAGPAADLWWGRGVWAANAIVLLLSPLVGAIADESGRKKAFLFATYLLCVGGTASLWFVGPGDVALGLLLFVISNVAFSFGENFAASFLPEISTPANVGKISGFGWGLGYFGGLASLLLVRSRIDAGFTLENLPSLRQAWVLTAGFFLLAGLPTFLVLRERAPRRSEPFSYYLRNGFGRLATTVRSAAQFRELVRFLVVFFVFSMGLTSIIAFVGVYAERTVGFTASELIGLFLVVQVSSAAGAFAFGAIQDRLGARRTIQITLLLWIGVCAAVWASNDKGVFWIVALVAGLGIGSLQSASRAMVGLFSPVDKSGEFFGLWGLAGKGAYACGPLTFGWISAASGSQRTAVAATATFFALGFLGMFLVDERRGREAASAWSPGPGAF
ncbi:MAG TPA: MFS transporter [Thermoanaerobaculia bacterium]|nr:MFS transporter [Thermoanaerobaculia bacterium]